MRMVGSEIFNIQYGAVANDNGGSANANMNGVVPGAAGGGTVWNYLNQFNAYFGQTRTNQLLVNDAGSSASGVRLSFVAPEGNAIAGSGSIPTLPLFRAGQYASGSGGSNINFTIGSLNLTHSYDLYLYSSGTPAGLSRSTFHVQSLAGTSASLTPSGLENFGSFNGTNYVLFSGLSPTAGAQLIFTKEGPVGGSFTGTSGFTLVDNGVAVPEPSTFVLAGLGLLGLGFVALRKKNRRA